MAGRRKYWHLLYRDAIYSLGSKVLSTNEVFVIVTVLINAYSNTFEAINVQLALERFILLILEPSVYACFTMCALQVRWDRSLSRRHDALAGEILSAKHYLDVLDDTNSFWSWTWKHLPCGCHEAMCERLYFSTSWRNLCNFKGKTIEGPTVLSSSFIDAALVVILNSHAIVEANVLTVNRSVRCLFYVLHKERSVL